MQLNVKFILYTRMYQIYNLRKTLPRWVLKSPWFAVLLPVYAWGKKINGCDKRVKYWYFSAYVFLFKTRFGISQKHVPLILIDFGSYNWYQWKIVTDNYYNGFKPYKSYPIIYIPFIKIYNEWNKFSQWSKISRRVIDRNVYKLTRFSIFLPIWTIVQFSPIYANIYRYSVHGCICTHYIHIVLYQHINLTLKFSYRKII